MQGSVYGGNQKALPGLSILWYKPEVISLFISSNWYVDINMTEGALSVREKVSSQQAITTELT